MSNLTDKFKVPISEELKFDWDYQPDPPTEPCRGLIFRCERTSYLGSDGSVNFKTRFRPLLRKSCPGCSNCGWIQDDLHERLNEYYAKWDPGSFPIIFDDAENGKMYQLAITGVSTDWETGAVDDYDLEFVKYEEENDGA